MATTTAQSSTSALHEILGWATNRPEWQQDALRRIVAQTALDSTDIHELDRLCRAKYGADTSSDPPIKAERIGAGHLPPAPGASASVSIACIGGLQRVGRIPPDQTITFGPSPGLSIIYGDNGTGKSGFARVLKKACRTRGDTQSIRPDAFAPPSTTPAAASITCRVAGTDVPLTWTDGAPIDPRLAHVFVFDSDTAKNYLQQDDAAAFTPNGLDVLPKLSQACDTIKGRIQIEIEKISIEIDGIAQNWDFDSSTAVGKLIVGLSASTTSAQVDGLASMDDMQTTRVKDLVNALKDDPKLNAKKTRDAAARLNAFAAKINTAATDLSDLKIEVVRRLIEDAQATTSVANAFTTKQFDARYLTGTGSALWFALWEAARSYSEEDAYKGQAFPVTGDAMRCVLCQQDLDEQAAVRLKRLEAYCKDQSQELAKAAAQRLKAAAEKVTKTQPLSSDDINLEIYADVASPEQLTAISDFVIQADARLVIIKESLSAGTWTAPAVLPISPASILGELEAALESRAKMEESAADEKTRAALKKEYDELAAREWLLRVKSIVIAQIERFKGKAKLAACLKDTATNQITEKSKALTKQFVTDAFCRTFKAEIKSLGLRTLAVEWAEVRGTKGEVKFGPRLVAASGHPVQQIASEGEQRCIALAAFLAELSQTSHQSALVFDDPVSSLDQRYRVIIAERLVTLCTSRQVIVFSHDILFVHELLARAEQAKQVPSVMSLEWGDGKPGKVVHGLSWDCSKPKERLNELRKIQKSIASAWNPVPNAMNVEAMRDAYSKLRATMEGIIEREILAGVVCRFDSQVYSGKLKRLVGIPQAECVEADRILQRCHEVTNAHYTAPGKHTAIPEPADLLADIDAAETIRSQAIARHGR